VGNGSSGDCAGEGEGGGRGGTHERGCDVTEKWGEGCGEGKGDGRGGMEGRKGGGGEGVRL